MLTAVMIVGMRMTVVRMIMMMMVATNVIPLAIYVSEMYWMYR